MIKIGYVHSYKYPNYVRTQFILQLLEDEREHTSISARNTSTGIVRYIQTIGKLIAMRIRHNPDVYILGFRGTEIYWLVRLLTYGKPLVYDEFLNPYLWVVEEHQKLKKNQFIKSLVKHYVRYTLHTADLVLSDTNIHAQYSADNFRVPRSKFLPLYVGTNEELFHSDNHQKHQSDRFEVFFYGNFLPLHGLQYILDAANELKSYPDIHFTIIGGANRKQDMEAFLAQLRAMKLTNVDHKPWVEYEELPRYIAAADVCLGGPFGNTPQAQKVITGKTYQFLAMGKATIIGIIKEDVGFR